MLTAGNLVECMYSDGHYYPAKIMQSLSTRQSGIPTSNDRFVVVRGTHNPYHANLDR
jgi:hypothetical protein